MGARTQKEATGVMVAREDLIAAWSALEALVVSLHRIGSYYSTSGPDVPLEPERRQRMLEDLDAFVSAELVRELGAARVALSEYLPDDEAEHLSEHVIQYWSSADASGRA